MPAAYTTLKLTDGTVSADLVDGVNYQLIDGGWAPKVARRRRGKLGRHYTDVVEEMTINVLSEISGAACLANLVVLINLLEQAAAWEEDGDADAVLLQVLPQGSVLTNPLQAAVLGGRELEALMELPATYNDLLMIWEIAGVKLKIERRGLWLGDEEEVAASAAEVGNIVTLDFGSSALAPVSLQADFGTASGTISDTSIEPFYLLLGKPAHFARWPLGASGVDDSANHALEDYVLRYTPSNTNENQMFGFTVTPSMRRAHIFVVAKSNSATANFAIRCVASRVYLNDEFAVWGTTEPKTIYAGDTARQIVYLGLVALPENIRTFGIMIQASAAADSFDIDDFVALGDYETSSVFAVGAGEVPAGGMDIGDYGVAIKHQQLTRPQPTAGLFKVTGPGTTDLEFEAPAVDGNRHLLMDGDQLSVLMLSVDQTDDYWRWHEAGSDNIIQYTVTAARRPAYLIPR